MKSIRSGAAKKAMTAVALNLMCNLLLVGCNRSNELAWTEDVKLPDGQVLKLSRWVEFKGGGSQFGDPSTESLQTLEFKRPGSAELVKWKNSIDEGRLSTVALWLEQGQPMLLAMPSYGGDSIRYDCPNPPYLLFEYVSGQWRPKPLEQIPVKRIRANMTTHPLEMREEIEKSERQLTATQTSNSYTYRDGVVKVPYVIQFENMPVQTFAKYENCNRPPNYLLLDEGRLK